ncbi:hypothetical protein EYB25_009814 [Talaromyces marneffei]|nr:hypothetical protein EYB25_009814 [Talaromyces marneffei]
MSILLHFRGVALHTTEAALQAKFEEYGEVKDFRDAEAAAHDMNNKDFDGQIIQVVGPDYIPRLRSRSLGSPQQAQQPQLRHADSNLDLFFEFDPPQTVTGYTVRTNPEFKPFQAYASQSRVFHDTPFATPLAKEFERHNSYEFTQPESSNKESLKDSDINDENTKLGPGYNHPTEYSRDYSSAAETYISQKLEVINFRWELPSLLKIRVPSAGHRAKTEFVLGAITLVVRGKYIEPSSCRQYLDKFYPEKGVKLVETILRALDTSKLVAVEPGLAIRTSNHKLMIQTYNKDLEAQIKDIAVWLCLTFRFPRNGSTPMVSTGMFDGTTFKLSVAPMFAVLTCWYPLFGNAVVVLKPSEPFPSEGGLLKLSFGALLQLAAVEYPVMVDSGLDLVGYSTALVPIEINNEGQILWHLEISSGNQQLRKPELQATKGSWLQKQSLEELQTTEALLGWCSSANIQLGTYRLKTADVTWSTARVKPTTWHWKGANLQLLAQSAAPLQIGGQVGFSWERNFNTIRFPPGNNYTRCLANSKLESVILYDVTAQRAWLVPLLSAYHHMLLIYHEKQFPSGSNPKPIPVVAPSSNGASSSFEALSSSGGVIVEGRKEDALAIRDVIMGFSINFSKTDVQPPKRSHIYGYELLDLVIDSSRSELKTITVDRHGSGWAPLLKEIPYLFCAELGEAIVGTRSSKHDSPSNSLPREQDLLASQLATIQMLCNKQGSTFTSISGQVTQTQVFQQEQLFTQCDHSLQGASSYWDHPEAFVQKLQRLQRETDKKKKGTGVNGVVSQMTGAIILGDLEGHIFERASDFWR